MTDKDPQQAGNYKATLNLPHTSFPMKANLTVLEPRLQARWEEMGLYARIQAARAGRPQYILHDGPPYANGDVHIGTGLNKVLKDVVVRYKTMRGFDSPFVPGWDCHGLPIEVKVLQDLGDAAKTMSQMEVRRRCRAYAERYVDVQRQQFRRLGVTGDWPHPYITMSPRYEQAVIQVLGEMVEAGCIYRALKPIHWCIHCHTALADAELEYEEDESPAVFVRYPLGEPARRLFPGLGPGERAELLIWTTTPWTLPANLAIALHPDYTYAAARYRDPADGKVRVIVLVRDLIPGALTLIGVSEYEELGARRGRLLEGLTYENPLGKRTSPVVVADYVTLREGTGCVHTAPGHGHEDHLTGLKYGLEPLSPVDGAGLFTPQAGEFAGMNIFQANPRIVARLRELGMLFHEHRITHSYPHCWRCKEPVIFRATTQWFVDLDRDGLRERALAEVARTRWIPPWGEVRIHGMMAERPDWCISRQKAWGVPIPAFYCTGCGELLFTKAVCDRVAQLFGQEGSDAWFLREAGAILGDLGRCPKCGGADLQKESDILDVWFESGSSHRAVLEETPGLRFPADLYLEGTDQHRGWFQLSLWPAVATRGQAPFREVLTHGFVVDENGEKFSKSRGGDMGREFASELGADVLRLWLSSVNFHDDIRLSEAIISRFSDSYRKVRNTFRFLLGNLSDFDPVADRVPSGEMTELDRWALDRLHRLIRNLTSAYDDFAYYRAYHQLYDFAVVDMSSFYLDVLKDRLYTFAPDDHERRSSQTALADILLALTRMCAPILVHTAEEVWLSLPEGWRDVESVHLSDWPRVNEALIDDQLARRWEQLLAVRGEVNRGLEQARNAKLIGSSLEASVQLWTEDAGLRQLLEDFADLLPTLFIVSEASLTPERGPDFVQGLDLLTVWVKVAAAPHPKCSRCWNLRPSVGQAATHPSLCSRCVKVVEKLSKT
jgi:isoleucyl-tRNA synthetase